MVVCKYLLKLNVSNALRHLQLTTYLYHTSTDNEQEWITQTAEKNPAEALKLSIALVDFVLPRMSRTSIDENKQTEQTWTINYAVQKEQVG